VGLLTSLLTFPLSGPVAGIRWSLEQVKRVVDDELTDDAPIKQELMELQLRLEVGHITDADYVTHEADLMARLRAVREWREQLGRETTSGPVRVATPAAEVTLADDVDRDAGAGGSPSGEA
jgi:gas vesicle protein GvpG